MNKSKEEVELLRQYVKALENQMNSKNEQIRTLNIQIENLSKSQSTSNISRSQVIYTSNCNQCKINKQQLEDFRKKYSLLETNNSKVLYNCQSCSRYKKQAQEYKEKYENLLKNYNSSSTKSNVIYSSACSQCSNLKNQLIELQQKYSLLYKQSSTNYSSFVSTSSTNQQIQYFKRQYLKILDQKKLLQKQLLSLRQLKGSSNSQFQIQLKQCRSQILSLRGQLSKKQDIIRQLRSQLMSYSSKITILQAQIQNLGRTNIYNQNNSQKVKYLNSQIEHYLALSNSLKSQIQVLKEQNHGYMLKIRQLQNRPKQVEYIHVESSSDLKHSINELRMEITELTNNNIFIQQQNQNLRLKLIQLSKIKRSQPQYIQIIRTENHSPLRLYMEEEKVGKHYRKPHYKDNSKIRPVSYKNNVFFEKQKYGDLQRRIYALQVENQNLKTNLYTKI